MIEPPQLLLPFAERDYVDMAHACRILGTSWATVYRLHKMRKIRIVDYRYRSWKRVHYGSIVEYCDQLRNAYCIPDRKPPLAADFLRYRDEDVLPFTLADIIQTAEALAAIGRVHPAAIEVLIDEGEIEAYRIMPKSPWRISRTSMIAYLNRICMKPARTI